MRILRPHAPRFQIWALQLGDWVFDGARSKGNPKPLQCLLAISYPSIHLASAHCQPPARVLWNPGWLSVQRRTLTGLVGREMP